MASLMSAGGATWRRFLSPRQRVKAGGQRQPTTSFLSRNAPLRRFIPRRWYYGLIFAAGLLAIWSAVSAYVVLTRPSYTSQVGLILPGAGASSSINLSEIGQATSSAPSAYGSSALSPTVTYKNLLLSQAVLDRAGQALRTSTPIGKPVIKLVNETSLIRFAVGAPSPKEAQARAEAVLEAFQSELDRLREDEIRRRQRSVTEAIGEYESGVRAIRSRISELQVSVGLNSAEQYGEIVVAAETLRARLVDARASWEEASGAVDRLAAMLQISPDLAVKTLKLHADPEFNALMLSIGKASSDAAELADRFGPRHPRMVAAAARLAGLTMRAAKRAEELTGVGREQALQAMDRSSNGNRAELLAHLIRLTGERDGKAAEMKSLTADYDKANARVQTLLGPATRLEGLNRDYKIAEAVFASALARIDTVKADVFASYPLVQVLEAPDLPTRPSSPKVLLALAAGVAASLMFGVGLALLWVRHTVIDLLIGRRDEPHASAAIGPMPSPGNIHA